MAALTNVVRCAVDASGLISEHRPDAILLQSDAVTAAGAEPASFDALPIAITCDGQARLLKVSLVAVNGGLVGQANLRFGDEGLSPDGSIGAISVYVDEPVRVVAAG